MGNAAAMNRWVAISNKSADALSAIARSASDEASQPPALAPGLLRGACVIGWRFAQTRCTDPLARNDEMVDLRGLFSCAGRF
jgi:hypothetical protein